MGLLNHDLKEKIKRNLKQIPEWIAADDQADKTLAPIDVLIPIIEKDLETVTEVVKHVRQYLLHPIHQISFIAPKTKKILDAAESLNCKFIDESTVLPIQVQNVQYFVDQIDRSGWLFQQFLKWSEDLSTTQHYLLLDADTLLVRPRVFLKNNKTVLLTSDEHHSSYRKFYELLLGYPMTSRESFISHHMLIDKEKVRELKKEIEARSNGKKWYEQIIFLLKEHPKLSFSEYETYGNWLLNRYPESVITRYWGNIAINRKSDFLKKKHILRRYWSVSLHSYLNEN